jgi:ABC-2 type transport system ATP-binding protein
MPALLELEGVSFRYPKSQTLALDSVTLAIPRGSFFALLGPNGAGKTTLLRLACGRFSDFAGSLTVAEDCRNPAGFLDSRCYGVLLENPGAYPRLTVGEYLHYFAGFYGLEKQTAENRGREILDKLNGPSWDVKLSTLSLGNRQKLQIARALIHNPKVLILDEPVANLDPESREMVWQYIGGWRKTTGGTAIVCSHILAEMEAEATDYAIIDKGRILRSGTLGNALPQRESTRFDVEFAQPVDESVLRKVLSAAQMEPTRLNPHGASLADIYKQTVRQ